MFTIFFNFWEKFFFWPLDLFPPFILKPTSVLKNTEQKCNGYFKTLPLDGRMVLAASFSNLYRSYFQWHMFPLRSLFQYASILIRLHLHASWDFLRKTIVLTKRESSFAWHFFSTRLHVIALSQFRENPLSLIALVSDHVLSLFIWAPWLPSVRILSS